MLMGLRKHRDLQLAIGALLSLGASACGPRPDDANLTNQSAQTQDSDLVEALRNGTLSSFRKGHAEQCLTMREAPSNNVEQHLARYREIFRSSSLGARTVQAIEDQGVSICDPCSGILSSVTQAGVFRGGDRTIGYGAGLREGVRQVAIAHELRHAWQNSHGLLNSSGLSKEARAARVFMTEADSRTFTVAWSWQQKQVGNALPWNAVTSMWTYQPIAEAFENRMNERQAAGLSTSSDQALSDAMGHAFKGWFADPRIRGGYIDGIEDLYRNAGDNWTGENALPANFTDRLGGIPHSDLPRGSSYLNQQAVRDVLAIVRADVNFNPDPIPTGPGIEPPRRHQRPSTPACALPAPA